MFSSYREISLSLPLTQKPSALIIIVWQVEWKGLKKVKIETQSKSSVSPLEMGFRPHKRGQQLGNSKKLSYVSGSNVS